MPLQPTQTAPWCISGVARRTSTNRMTESKREPPFPWLSRFAEIIRDSLPKSSWPVAPSASSSFPAPPMARSARIFLPAGRYETWIGTIVAKCSLFLLF